MASAAPRSGGILLVDKPAGITSHGVVAAARKKLGTRKIGHAGTLDPMATGLLVLGVDAATRLLTFIVGADKTYTATIRLGATTSTDDAEGDPHEHATQEALAEVSDADIEAAMRPLRGEIDQVPSSVSAIKVDGVRAYDRVRSGESVALAARTVTVSRFDVTAVRRSAKGIDLDVIVDCSSGTYIRALARDLGAALGVGGHLTALRRTRVGGFAVAEAASLEQIGPDGLLRSSAVIAELMPVWQVDDDVARDLRHGKRIRAAAGLIGEGTTAAIDPDGDLIGIVERRGRDVASVMNMPEPARGVA